MRLAALCVLGIAMEMMIGCSGGNIGPNGMTTPATPLPTDSISGTVTFKGAPLAGATVTEWSTNTNQILATTTTDASGNYSFTGIQTSGNVPLELHLWASKTGYGFTPGLAASQSNAKVIRADHTGQFVQTSVNGVPMYFTVIDFVAQANESLAGANFAAYDGSNPPANLGATGQKTTYAPGDDGALSKGAAWPEQRFSDNGDGSVTDNLTGLVWLRDAGCFPQALWQAAVTEVHALASGQCSLTDSSKAGDWRMPNLVEMESLIDASAANPALTPNHPFRNIAAMPYWTSTSYFGGETGSPQAWAVRLADGSYINDSVQNVKATSALGVWAVRGTAAGTVKLQASGLFVGYLAGDDGSIQAGVPLVGSRFIENGNGTVTDAVTGLIWLKQANCLEGDWATEVAATRSLASGQCGLTDGSTAGQWRMPNRKEMQSLADRNQNNEAYYLTYTFLNSDQTVFQPAILVNFFEQSYYWTSTTDAADPTQAWTVYSCDYGVYATPKSNQGYTLAVR
jgi:hypothetical protein